MNTIEKKVKAFSEMVLAQADPKFKHLLDEFIEYWTEPDKKQKQIRYDGEKYFKVNSRLATWEKRRKKDYNGAKSLEVRAEIITHRTTSKLEQMSIEELENAYNGEREGKYVHIKYFDVFDFLRSKGFIPKKNFTKEEMEYFKKTKYNAQGMVYARFVDKLKNCKPEHEKELRDALNNIKAGKHHEIEPQAKVLVLTDLFKKYSLEQIKAKINK